jgi:mannose-6-phosphate isomerase-like protein (cupin superfamily)
MAVPYTIPPGEGRLLDLGVFEAVVLADHTQTDGEFSLLRAQREPQGFGPPMHIHHDAAEAFYVLEGTYLMFFGDRREECPPGTFVYVPRGLAHTFQVVSEEPGQKLNLFTPAAMVGFFERLSAAKGADEASEEVLDAIAREHAMEIVGPVPDLYL